MNVSIEHDRSAMAANESDSAECRSLSDSEFKIAKILAPVDFSDSSERIVRYAAAIALRSKGKVTLLHVLDESLRTSDFRELDSNLKDISQRVRHRLELMATRFGDSRIFAAPQVREGRPSQTIEELARASETDLMIISSHGFSGIGYILLGGTAERVVRHVNCPVLVLNKREDIVVDPRRILVPVDFSPASIDGLRYALGFAHLFSAEITVMHVISPASLTDWMADGLQGYEYEQGERAKSKLSDLEKSVNSPGRSFQTVFRHGVPYHEIVQKAAKAKYDLIILGSNGSGGLVDTLLGSTAERVIHHAPCPVLVVRRSASSD